MKKIIALVACLSLVASLVVGGSVAYLQDQEEAVNVMTLGNVDIEQTETDAAGNEFKQNQPLYPAYINGTDIEGAIEKVVSVENVGDSDAYVRTLIAFEAGDLNYYEFMENIHAEFETDAEWLETPINVGGVNYYVACFDFTKDEPMAKGEIGKSLKQVYMDPTATNEIVKQFGTTYDIAVVSQAVQTNNMPNAAAAWEASFGAFNAANAEKWFSGVAIPTVGTAAEVTAALAKGGDVTLSDDVALDDVTNLDKDANINLNGNTLNARLMLVDGVDVTIANGSVVNNDKEKSAIAAPAGTEVTLDNVNVTSARHALRAEGGDMTINGGTYKVEPVSKSTLHALNVSDGSTVIINGGTFIGPKGTQADSGSAVSVRGNSTVIINDGDFSGGKLKTLSCDADSKLIVNGGTFDQDPSAYVDLTNYSVTEKDGKWTVALKPAVVMTAEELLKALEDPQPGNTIKFGANIKANLVMPRTVENITIDGDGYMLQGVLNLNGSQGATIKNVIFDAQYAEMGCDGKGNAKQNAMIITGDNTNKPNRGARNLTIENCTFMGTFANGGASIAFTDQNRGSGASGNVTIKDCTFDTEKAYYDIYGHYTGNGNFVIENNNFKTAFSQGCPIYLGRYQSGTPVVVKGNTFETVGSQDDAMYVQDHSSYGVSIDAANNTYAQ